MIISEKIISEFLRFHRRPIENAYTLLQAGYFIKYGISDTNVTDGTVTIKGLCLQNSYTKKEPHSIAVIIDVQKNNIRSSYCTCVGGASGKCKHCAALLVILSR